MAAAVSIAAAKQDPPIPDCTQPIKLKWWRVPPGEFHGTIADGYLGLGAQISDGVDISGTIETLWLLPSGVCLAGVRVSAPSGTLRWLVFKNGHGAPL